MFAATAVIPQGMHDSTPNVAAGDNSTGLFGQGFSASQHGTNNSEIGNLDVFGGAAVPDFNMSFEEDVPIRERACSWDLAMDQDVDPASDPMTPAISSHSHPLPSIPGTVGLQGPPLRNNFNFASSGGDGDNEPPIFDDNLQFVDPMPTDYIGDGRESDDSYDISNGIATRYTRYRHHNFNLRNSGMQLEGQYGPGIEEPKKKRKVKVRQKCPKAAHALGSDMSLSKKRGRKPGKISGTGKHESRKFDAQMRPRIKGRFVSRKMYQDLYGDGDGEGEDGEDGENENKSEGENEEGDTTGPSSNSSSSSLDTDGIQSNTSTDVEEQSSESKDESSISEDKDAGAADTAE